MPTITLDVGDLGDVGDSDTDEYGSSVKFPKPLVHPTIENRIKYMFTHVYPLRDHMLEIWAI